MLEVRLRAKLPHPSHWDSILHTCNMPCVLVLDVGMHALYGDRLCVCGQCSSSVACESRSHGTIHTSHLVLSYPPHGLPATARELVEESPPHYQTTAHIQEPSIFSEVHCLLKTPLHRLAAPSLSSPSSPPHPRPLAVPTS